MSSVGGLCRKCGLILMSWMTTIGAILFRLGPAVR